jgi:hypothetical protein
MHFNVRSAQTQFEKCLSIGEYNAISCSTYSRFYESKSFLKLFK